MRTKPAIGLDAVCAAYSAAEARLWELVMGEQIHIGGFESSTALSEAAGLGPGMKGVDLCCCTGAGMRFLVRFRGVNRVTGIDATAAMVDLGRRRCAAEGLADRIDFVLADACDCGLPSGEADFVWGEDAWCYVEDKGRLIAEAARLLRRGGTLAFTDWVEGPVGLSGAEAGRFMTFMKFPSLATIEDYRRLMEAHGCRVFAARDTGRFVPAVDLYLAMLEQQLYYDALKILDFDQAILGGLCGEMRAMCDLARAGKIAQGLFVSSKT